MKKLIVSGIIVFAVALLAPQIVQAQETTYLSNLGQPSTGSEAVGSDSWLGEVFITGANTSGYTLNSVQLAMTGASGNPSGFTVMIYKLFMGTPFLFGTNLGTLGGSANPSTAGIYTYNPAVNLTLSPNTGYAIVLNAGTAVADGAYEWSESTTYPISSGGWPDLSTYNTFFYSSNDGSSWTTISGAYPQFAINATVVPEPGVLSLFGLGGLGFLWRRWKAWAI